MLPGLEEPMRTDRDLVIVGGGGAGMSAAQYGARGNLNTLLIEELSTGGQALVIDALENYPGFPEPINGFDFSQRMEEQARKFGAELLSASVSSVVKKDGIFVVETDRGPVTALAVILATGAKHRHLGVPGEEQLAGKGVSYCATCDGPFFRQKRMVVVGGGDAACDEAMYLSNLASGVLMLHRRDKFRAQKSLASRVLKNPKIEVRFNTQLLEIQGSSVVQSVLLKESPGGREYQEQAAAVFIFIGSDPQARVAAGVELDEAGYIVTDQKMQSSIPGLFAAGDVRSSPFRQLVVAAGEGAVAAHVAGQYIDELKGEAYR
jgi:thioredoxin reductase (NADPH)